MAKKQSTTKSVNKSDVIREIIGKQPKATVSEIRSALQERGIKVSDALINKIKYGRGRKGGKTRARKNGESKADAIRGMLEQLGAKARPRDVISELATRGVVVSSAQVSTLQKLQSRRGPSVGRGTHAVSLEHLRAAKALADRLGGIENAQQALASLATLLNN